MHRARCRLGFGAVGLAVALAAAAGGAAAAAPIDTSKLPASMHGAVETQAVTVGNGAVALLVDPGTAYAYSTVDRDDYGGGSVAFTMTARGANVNPGTIVAAVLWAPPNCSADGNVPCFLSGGYGTPNTGMHEAKGFPAYAEALYPPPPEDSGLPSQERVYKCIVNKDGPGSPPTGGSAQEVCRQSDAVPLTAWAEAIGEEVRSTGFSRAAGFDVPGALKVGSSESRSEVKPLEDGRLESSGYSAVTDISILGGQVTIESVKSSARIVGGATGAIERSASCTFAGLSIAGSPVALTGGELPVAEIEPLLDEVAAATGYLVEIVPPTPVVAREAAGGKQVAECAGLQVKFTDTRTTSPVPVCLPEQPDPNVPACVPALANREEFSFGKVSAQQSVNEFAPFDTGALAGGADLGGEAAGAAALDVGGSGQFDASLSATAPAGDLAGGAVGGGAGSGTSGSSAAVPSTLVGANGGVNVAAVGTLAAAAAFAMLVGILLLIATVNGLAAGTGLRLPGL